MSQPAAPTTVLVVDDEEGIRHALERFLTRVGYRVLEAEDGPAALALVGTDRPHAVLSDIRMPKMSGVDLVPKLLTADPDLAVVMLTAIDEPRTAIECMKLGAFDYLIKPIDLDELELALRGALRRRQLEIDRRNLEAWLAREVALRTQLFEQRIAAVEVVALDAIAAAGEKWKGAAEALRRLSTEAGTPVEELRRAVKSRRS